MQDWLASLKADPTSWLLEQGAPWVRYRTLVDLLDKPETGPQVAQARLEMLNHPAVQGLIKQAAAWPGYPLTRHNDAKHPLHALTVLADFGLGHIDPGMDKVITQLRQFRSPEGAFETLTIIPAAFGGSDTEELAWMLCDAPTIAHALVRYGLGDEPDVCRALDHISSLVESYGWPCAVSPDLGKFRGPGSRDDSCPYANLISVRALAVAPDPGRQTALDTGVEMLLNHWEHQSGKKKYLFGIGTTYRQPKYPFIWYDILHVLDTLSTIPATRCDTRYREMLHTVLEAQDEQGRFKAGSVWMAWKDWEFAQKRQPSQWITFLALRILKRSGV